MNQTTPKTLWNLSSEMAALEALLEENGGELTPEVEERLADTSESLVRKADGYGALIRKTSAASTMIADEIKRLQAMKKVTDNTVKRLKEHIATVMEATGMTKLDGDLTKFTLTHSTSCEVDEDAFLAPYQQKILDFAATLPEGVSLEVKVSKSFLKERYKGGDILPAGVQFVNNASLRIR